MVDDLWVQGANMRFITLLGTKSFMNTFGSVGTGGESPVAEDEQKKEGG